MIILGLAGTVGVPASGASDEEATQKLLFVGNSFTYTYDVPGMLASLAASSDPPEAVDVKEFTMGGATLGKHIIAQVPQRLRDGDYDVVILQGDIPENYSETTDRFVEAATELIEAGQEGGARTVMYMTWPYARLDHIELDDIVGAHRELEATLGVSVAPVGLAFERARETQRDLSMLGPDAEHPTVEGANLAAATIYAALFEHSPEGIRHRSDDWPASLTGEEAAFLQRVAWETVQAWLESSPNP